MGGGGGGLGAAGEGLGELADADVLGFAAFGLLELPHAESDPTVAAVTARIASRVNRYCVVALIRVLRSRRCARGTRCMADLHNY
jgi:hypothetical protein